MKFNTTMPKKKITKYSYEIWGQTKSYIDLQRKYRKICFIIPIVIAVFSFLPTSSVHFHSYAFIVDLDLFQINFIAIAAAIRMLAYVLVGLYFQEIIIIDK